MKAGISITVVVVLSLLSHSVASAGAPGEDMSVDSWVYEALHELSAYGSPSGYLLQTRPLSRKEVVEAVREYRTGSFQLSRGAEILLKRLEEEFREELRHTSSSEHTARIGIGPTSRVLQFREGVTRNRIGFDAQASFSMGDAITARMRVRFDSDGRHDSQFHGEYWKENFTAWVEQAATVVRWKRLTAAFGREYWRWGPSPHDAMLVSGNSPPFDGLRLRYRAHNWSYSFHATVLDRMLVFRHDYVGGDGTEGLADRYLVAHRLNWRPRHNLEVAASEVMLFGGFDRRWQWNYLNPLLPYYWEQLNNDTNDNPLWNFELTWRVLEGLQIYGEWMIDDFQIDFESEPQQIGLLLGVTSAPSQLDGLLTMNAEYQRINTFVYGQGQPWNRYFHHRDMSGNVIGIGSNLGTDADRITIIPKFRAHAFVDLIARFDYLRRGENRISDPQESGVPKGIPFPSGTVERETRFGAGAHVRWRGNVVADALVGFYEMKNAAHVPGDTRSGLFFQFRLDALFWKSFRV